MSKTNLTVGVFSVPFAEGFVEEDGQVVPNFKSLKRFAAILSYYGPFNLKFILPEEGQLGVLTETGYHDGVLGLVQEGVSTVDSTINKVDMCLLPLSLDTQKAPGYFTSVISEMDYYIVTCRNLNDQTSALISSLTSVNAFPLLLSILTILILELIAVKHFKIEALMTAIFRSFAFSTQTIVGTADFKVDTLKDVINQGKIPRFMEGISMYDFFKGKVTKDYADIYERAVANGFGEPFPLGPITGVDRIDKMVTFVSGVGRKLAPLSAAGSNLFKPNQVQYFSAKPFHRALQATLFSYNASKLLRKKFDTLSRRMIQSGVSTKIEGDIYTEFILSFYPATLYDLHKSQAPQKGDDLNWQSLNYRGFYQIFHLLILLLILSLVVLLIESIIAFLIQSKCKTNKI